MWRGVALAWLALAWSAPAHAATLVYSNDVLGEIEPCGCRANPMGGLIRKANMLKGLPDSELLQLDAGDLLFNSPTIPQILKDQSVLQARYLLRGMEKLGHDAITPGEKDFALGLKVFDELRKGTKIPFLAANLARKNGKLLLKGSQIFLKKGKDGKKLRIGVIGLVGTDVGIPGGELKVLPVIPAAKKEVARLRKQTDLLIALTHQGYEEDEKLAKAVPGLDLIVGAHTQSFIQNPPKLGTAWIVQSSYRNQYIGVLPLGTPLVLDEHKLIGLDEGYNGATPMEALVQEFKVEVARINTERDASVMAQSLGDQNARGSSQKFQTFTKCAECHSKQFDFWRGTRHAGAFETLVKVDQAKNKDCLSCHSVGLGDSQGFQGVLDMAERAHSGEGKKLVPFAEVAEYLRQVHQAKGLDSEVKAYQLAPGPSPTPEPTRVTLTRSLSMYQRVFPSVQCENCHQPGRDHPFSGTYTKTVAKEHCLKCHTAERAPKWYTPSGQPDWKQIEQKHAQIACPAGDSSESN